MSHNTFSGARAVFRIDGQKIAWASGVEIGEEIQHEPIDVLDNLEVQEHVPLAYRVSFSASIFRTIKNTPGAQAPREGQTGSLKEIGLFPKTGADVLNALRAGTMTATIHDRLTGKIVAQVERVRSANNNFSLTARGVVGQNVSFVAIRVKDESEV